MNKNQVKGELARRLATSFGEQAGCLCVAGTPLTALAEQLGQTPFYAYSRQHIDRQVELLRRHIPKQISVHYAVKANPFFPLVQHLANKVEGLDVASAKEMHLAMNTGTPTEHISFAGPGKSDADLTCAIAAGVLINVESVSELARIDALAGAGKRAARISLRINPDYNLNSSGMKMGGGPRQFGMDVGYVLDAFMLIRDSQYLAFEGFQIYPGSQNLRADYLIDAQNKALDLVIRLSKDAPSVVKRFNLGGGFGVPYFEGDEDLDIRALGEGMRALAARAAKALPEAEIILELGRYLVASSGIYVSKVVDKKVSHEQVFLVVDGGMHHHLSASGNLGQLIRRDYPVLIGNKLHSAAQEMVNVVGPLCTPLDMLVNQGLLAQAEMGDLLVVFQSGAYGLSASPTGFLSQKPALEILL